jgi:hypothetical protein
MTMIECQKMSVKKVVEEMKSLRKKGKRPYLKSRGRKVYIMY